MVSTQFQLMPPTMHLFKMILAAFVPLLSLSPWFVLRLLCHALVNSESVSIFVNFSQSKCDDIDLLFKILNLIKGYPGKCISYFLLPLLVELFSNCKITKSLDYVVSLKLFPPNSQKKWKVPHLVANFSVIMWPREMYCASWFLYLEMLNIKQLRWILSYSYESKTFSCTPKIKIKIKKQNYFTF